MSKKRNVMALATRTALVATLGWLLVTGLRPAAVHAQLPLNPAGSVFEMTGFIQSATVDTPGDPLSGGTITLNNHLVVVPRNTIFQMPATSMTWQELFANAPAPYGPTQTGMALNDTPKPLTTFEVVVQGNRVEPAGTLIAGLVFLSQLGLQIHDGYLNFIDYTTGDLYVGGTVNTPTGTRVRINDPIGRFGRVMTHDARFTIDEENPTIKTETAYPMCVPRTDPAVADDPLCPNANRPLCTAADFVIANPALCPLGSPKMIFTMPPSAAPLATELANPSTRPVPLGGDPWRMAPFKVGDHVAVKGPLVADPAAPLDPARRFISAWGIDANVGIFTTPGTLPAYVAVDVILMGTGVCPAGLERCAQDANPTLVQEAARRMRVEGFTTDISTAISVNAIDVDSCTGIGTDRNWTLQAVDPGAPNGAVAGRWRFRPGSPLFNLKGFPFLPPTREAHAFSINGTVPAQFGLTGLKMGEYTLPNFDFIGPENLAIGGTKVPFNFDTMSFLTQGEGPRAAFGTGTPLPATPGQLSPWPGQTAPALKVCPPPPPVGTDVTSPVVSAVATNPVSPITALTTPTVTLSATVVDPIVGTATTSGVASVKFLFAGVTTTVTAPTVVGGSTFSVTVPTPPRNLRLDYFLSVTATDVAGNVSAPGLILVTVQ